MVEVFKTNVCSATEAKGIIELILKRFPGYQINFDLDDCDKILRVENREGAIRYNEIIQLVETFEFSIEVIGD